MATNSQHNLQQNDTNVDSANGYVPDVFISEHLSNYVHPQHSATLFEKKTSSTDIVLHVLRQLVTSVAEPVYCSLSHCDNTESDCDHHWRL